MSNGGGGVCDVEVEAVNCCFICEDESGELWSLCRCTDRVLHLECQRLMMNKTPSHRLGCPVCLTQYNNVKSVVKRRSLSNDGQRLVVFTIGVIIVLGIGVYEFLMFLYMRNASFLVVAIIFFVAVTLFVIAGRLLFANVPLTVEQRTVTVSRPAGGQRVSIARENTSLHSNQHQCRNACAISRVLPAGGTSRSFTTGGWSRRMFGLNARPARVADAPSAGAPSNEPQPREASTAGADVELENRRNAIDYCA